MKYDVLVVGAGLYGATFARICKDAGKSVLVIDSRDHIGGNCYDEKVNGITVHKYGAHIFHTSDKEVWKFINRFTKFRPFVNKVKAFYDGKYYSLPFNMNTFKEIYGIKNPKKAKELIESQKVIDNPKNLEEQAINLVGEEIYEKLIKGYTEKQWRKDCKELPPEIIKRLPIRYKFNNNYFNDKYQGIPKHGYTKMIEKLLEGIDVKLNTNYKNQKATTIVYTGRIDEFFNYQYGKLDFRTLMFYNKTYPFKHYQGRAVVNYTDKTIPYTRIIEHKYFLNEKSENTVVTFEYPTEMNSTSIPYYPINDKRNNELYNKYFKLKPQNVIFGGRLGKYKYLDMDDTIREALNDAKEYLENESHKI